MTLHCHFDFNSALIAAAIFLFCHPPYNISHNLPIHAYAADGKTVGLIVVALWADVATEEVQAPSVRRRGSTYRPEVAARALDHRRARRKTDVASIRKREWELACNILRCGRRNRWTYSCRTLGRRSYC